MKPCSKNRRLIAWLTLDALDARKAAVLRDHLAHCDGCRRYWEEISKVTDGLAAAVPDSNLEVSEFFHHRVAEKLRAQTSSLLENLTAWLCGSMIDWRVALPAIAALVITLFAMVAPRHHPALPRRVPPHAQAVPESSSVSDLAPTLANYQMVAGQSLDKLSELLNRQGNKSLPPAPVYTISSFEPGDAPF
jgi:hypothetical protein